MDFADSHPFLSTYLRYVRNTESPTIFHLWSAVSAISAALGRRCWLDTGIKKMYPNMFVVLSGPPATRKGAAIDFSSDLLKKNTSIRFAPNDTGGQRQGIIRAMTDFGEDAAGGNADDIIAEMGKDSGHNFSLGEINGKETANEMLAKLDRLTFDTRDPRTMYVVAGELNSILGENNTAMLTFLQEMWDGKDYRYTLRNNEYHIKDGLLSILGGTTATQIALALPPQAVGQGFTSRTIFVHADRARARIARPTLDPIAGEKLAEIYRSVFDRFEGAFEEDEKAATAWDEIYLRGIVMKDQRFLGYAERRGDHLRKVSMSLAAGRGALIINELDVRLADQLLLLTEEAMPDALGEYGMSPLSAAKQALLDIVRHSDEAIPTYALQGLMSRHVREFDFKNMVVDLCNAGKLSKVTFPVKGECLIAVNEGGATKARREYKELLGLMKGEANVRKIN